MKRIFAAVLAAGVAAATPNAASADAVVAGFDTSQFASNDDGYIGPLALGFSANFFGNTYSQTYLSNNGYITFNAGQSGYVPVGLGAGYSGNPIIAAFYDDVDTRGAGSGLTSYGTGTFDGRAAWGATWPSVGYYNSHGSPTNTFQILLVDRSDTGVGNFDIYLNYDHIGWETTDSSAKVAAAGYNAGTGNQDGTYYQLDGSLVTNAFLDGGPDALATGSNIGVAGRFEFNVRNGNVTPPPAVPEPATWAMMIAGFGLTGGALRRTARAALPA